MCDSYTKKVYANLSKDDITSNQCIGNVSKSKESMDLDPLETNSKGIITSNIKKSRKDKCNPNPDEIVKIIKRESFGENQGYLSKYEMITSTESQELKKQITKVIKNLFSNFKKHFICKGEKEFNLTLYMLSLWNILQIVLLLMMNELPGNI